MQRHRRSGTAPKGPEKAFGRILQEVRKQRGLSQEKLAFESGYHPTYISQLERGVKGPSLRTVLNLAAVLDVTAAQMVERVEAYVSRSRKHSRRGEAEE